LTVADPGGVAVEPEAAPVACGDGSEGMRAFAAKRPPEFEGR
jgi:hypothetical protein